MEITKVKIIPFDHNGEDNKINANTVHRLKVYRRFINAELPDRSLDIGQSNYIGRELNIKHNTHDTDFNYLISAPLRKYDAITCFEVLNHVMNPLQFMERIYHMLRKNGVCYLSHPKLWLIPWHHCKYNFVMYDPKRLMQLFEYAGFEIVRSETHNPWPWWFMFCGVRPFLRVIFNRIQIWELRRS